MSEKVPTLPNIESFWRTHVEAAEVFKGSNLEYCRLNHLKSSTFGGYKRRFGFVKNSRSSRKRALTFKKIEVQNVTEPDRKKTLEFESAEWIAKFLKEFLK
jgi:hypothetical protein